MIFQLGTIFLLGMLSLSGSNLRYPTYEYCAHFSNENVIVDAQLPYSTDESNYRLSISLAVDFDFYFNTDADSFICDNLVVTATHNTYYVTGTTVQQTNVLTYQPSGDFPISEVQNEVLNLSWTFNDGGSTCLWHIGRNGQQGGSTLYFSIYLSNYEDIVGTSGITYDIDFSKFYLQAHDFISYVAASNSYGSGFNDGYNQGYDTGYSDGSHDSYQTGYTDGYNEASDQDSVAVTIFTGICEVGLLPVNVFLGILNFEVFGINIGGFVASLMTIAIVVIVIRVVLGSKSKE